MAIKTFTHSVTLNPGEQFNLPPNSQVLFSTDPTGLESVCTTIPDTELKCYRMHWVINVDSEGNYQIFSGLPFPVAFGINNRTNAWETDGPSAAPILFSKVGGIGGDIDTGGISLEDQAALENFISASAFSGALMNRMYTFTNQSFDQFTAVPTVLPGNPVSDGNMNSGYLAYDMYFKSVDSIVDDFYFEISSDAENIAKKVRLYAEEVDCETYPITSVITVCDPNTPPPNPNDPDV